MSVVAYVNDVGLLTNIETRMSNISSVNTIEECNYDALTARMTQIILQKKYLAGQYLRYSTVPLTLESWLLYAMNTHVTTSTRSDSK